MVGDHISVTGSIWVRKSSLGRFVVRADSEAYEVSGKRGLFMEVIYVASDSRITETIFSQKFTGEGGEFNLHFCPDGPEGCSVASEGVRHVHVEEFRRDPTTHRTLVAAGHADMDQVNGPDSAIEDLANDAIEYQLV